MSRAWAMPNHETFSLPPASALLDKWLVGCAVIVDPFARNNRRGTHRNDLNIATEAEWHMDAAAFCRMLAEQGVIADAVLFDPPYSPRQVAEMYRSIGLTPGQSDTQTARLYREVRDGLDVLLRPGGIAISFGWNSTGFGKTRGYVTEEIVLIAHGAAHNDTIAMVERKVQNAEAPTPEGSRSVGAHNALSSSVVTPQATPDAETA